MPVQNPKNKSGMNLKLTENCLGPYEIVKKNTLLSYKVDMGRRIVNSLHIQLMKQYVQRDEALFVVSGKVGDPNREKDIQDLLTEFDTTITKEPDLTEFGIDTGDSPSIAQRPYNMPLALRNSVDHELHWLFEKGYIRKFTSQWVSPMVTVKKPDGSARICVDFKCINVVNTPLSF